MSTKKQVKKGSEKRVPMRTKRGRIRTAVMMKFINEQTKRLRLAGFLFEYGHLIDELVVMRNRQKGKADRKTVQDALDVVEDSYYDIGDDYEAAVKARDGGPTTTTAFKASATAGAASRSAAIVTAKQVCE